MHEGSTVSVSSAAVPAPTASGVAASSQRQPSSSAVAVAATQPRPRGEELEAGSPREEDKRRAGVGGRGEARPRLHGWCWTPVALGAGEAAGARRVEVGEEHREAPLRRWRRRSRRRRHTGAAARARALEFARGGVGEEEDKRREVGDATRRVEDGGHSLLFIRKWRILRVPPIIIGFSRPVPIDLRAPAGVRTRMMPPPTLPTPAAAATPRPAWNTNRNLVVTHPLLSLLESCASFRRLLQLHALLTVSGLAAHRFPASRLLAFCALSDPPRLAHAEAILASFAAPPGPNAYMLATMMRAYLRAGLPRRALALFRRVLRDRLPADARTLVFAVKAAAASSSPGGAVHCVALKRGFLGQSVLVGNALVHLYASGVRLPDARKLFDEMPERDVVSWTTLVDGYARGGLADEAWRVFCRMVVAEGVRPNRVTLVAAASAVGQMRLLGLGRTVHRCVAESGVNRTVNLDNALVDMFGKCGCVASAKEVFYGMALKDVCSWTSMVGAYIKSGDLENAARMFDDMPTRNAVSWSCMIAGYSQANQPVEAVRMFNDMLAAGVEPIDASLVSVLSACAQLGCLDLGRWMYDKYIASNKVGLTVNLGNAFIDMFAKCGDVDGAARLFGDMEERNLVSWNSMITAHAAHGQSEEALYLFKQFKRTGIVPDEITYTGVLSACSHSGLVSEGRYHFKEMKMAYGIEPRSEHCACMIDLLGKVGLLDEAFEIARSMPIGAYEAGWGALLNACRMHGNVEVGECAADKLVGLDPSDSGIYVLMSQIYASKSKWDQVKKLRAVMRDRGIKKNPGCSSIEVDGKFHEFLVADVSHVRSEDIYAALKNIYLHLKSESYIPFS